MIDGLAEETPTRDLAEQNGASLKTALLDYRRHLSFTRWSVAFKNGHPFLGSCMLHTVINTIILVPFAAHLFSAIPVNNPKKTSTFLLSTSYNASADIALADYASILATVMAVRTQGGQWNLDSSTELAAALLQPNQPVRPRTPDQLVMLRDEQNVLKNYVCCGNQENLKFLNQSRIRKS